MFAYVGYSVRHACWLLLRGQTVTHHYSESDAKMAATLLGYRISHWPVWSAE